MSTVPPPPQIPDFRAQKRMWAAQARLAKQQQRAERARLRMQRRMWRRRSIVGPLLFLALGIIFFLIQTGHMAWSGVVDWYGRWWPTVLIGAGLVMLCEWAVDRSLGEGYLQPRRRIGGVVALLLVVLLVFGVGVRAALSGLIPEDWALRDAWHNLARLSGQTRTSDATASAPLGPGAVLTIRNPHGDVSISSTSPDGQVHVNAQIEVYAWTSREADRIERELQPQFAEEGPTLMLQTRRTYGGRTDLTIQIPRNASLNVESGDGDTALDGVQGQVTVSANHGNVTLSNITGQVSARVHDDNGGFTAHGVQGPVSIEGRVGDVSLSDITGAVMLQGDFFGQTQMERIGGPTRFQSSRTQLQCTRINDQLEIDGGPELQGSGIVGPLELKTSNRNITLDRLQGMVQIQDRNGSVSVTTASPLASISIQNHHGTIDLGVPDGSGFSLDAQTRNGDLENDFQLQPEGERGFRTLRGNVGSGGPSISLVTTDGDVVVRKSSLTVPTPPVPPAPAAPASPHPAPAVKEQTF